MNANSQRLRRILVGILVVFWLTAAGCEDKRRHQPTQHVEFSATATALVPGAAPLDVGRSALDAMVRAQRARRDGLGIKENLAAYEEAIARLQLLASGDEIHKALISSKAYPADTSEPVAVTLMVESWVSMLAHYVDGIVLSSVSVRSPQNENSCTVYLEAVNPADAKRLADIRQRLAQSNGSAQGSTSKPAGTSQEKQVRDEALRVGLNPPLETGIEIRLTRRKDDWRVSQVRLVTPRPNIARTPGISTPATTTAPGAVQG